MGFPQAGKATRMATTLCGERRAPDANPGSPITDAEILAAVAKSKDLALITGAELLEAIDATRVAGLVSEHELDLVRWSLTEGGDA